MCAVVAALMLAACGGSTHATTTQAQPGATFGVAQVKRAFAAAALPLATTGTLPGMKPAPRAMLMPVLRRRRPPIVLVTVYRTTEDASAVTHPKTPYIADPAATTRRRGNVLVTWVGKENPKVATALRHLR